MADFSRTGPAPRLVTDRLREGLAYWEGKRGDRPMPARRDLDPPTEIPHLLPHIVLVDVAHDPLDFRYRLIGTAVSARIRRDYTGMRFMDIPHQRPGSRVWQAGVRVVAERKPLFSDIPYVGQDRYVLRYQDLLMPLSSDGEQVDMILGVMDFELAPKPRLF